MTAAIESKMTSDMVLFAQVVEAGTITAGSKKIGLERSTVSRRISMLEERLGIPLLDRTSRTLGLTEAGRRYYECCLKVVEAAEDAEAVTKGMQVQPRGVLHIHAAMSEVESFLSVLIDEFVAHNRNVRVELSLCENATMSESDISDIGLCLDPVVDSRLGTRRLASVGESLWANPGYLERHTPIRTPADLEEHACISHIEQHKPLRWHFTRQQKSLTASIQPRFRVQSLVSARQAAISGLGVVMLPNYLCREAEQRGDLVRLLPAWSAPSGELVAIYSTERFLARKATAFLDFLRYELNKGRYHDLLA